MSNHEKHIQQAIHPIAVHARSILRPVNSKPGRRRLLSCAAIAMLIPLMGGTCPVVITLPAPVKYVISMNRNRAINGERIHITWAFENERDANGNLRIASQAVQFIGHSIIRLDVPPAEFDMAVCTREIDFAFRGPVTVVLKAGLTDGGEISATVDVLLREDFFAVSSVRPENADYPRLGALIEQELVTDLPVVQTERQIIFSEFIAIHDKDDDGVIDQFAAIPELAALLSPDEDFRGHSLHVDRLLGIPLAGSTFPAFEIEDPETGQGVFRHSRGTRFPLVPDELRIELGRERCNAVIFAGALIYGGTLRDPPKLEEGEDALPVIENASDFDPVFVMIDAVDDGKSFTVTDVHIGNLKQGLVCSLRRGLDDARDDDRRDDGAISVTELERPAAGNGGLGLIRGLIKNALIAETVQTLAGDTVKSQLGNTEVPGAYVALDFVYFMPYVEDDNILPPNTIPGADIDADFIQTADPDCP